MPPDAAGTDDNNDNGTSGAGGPTVGVACWYVADVTHLPTTGSSGNPRGLVQIKRVKRAYAALQQRTERALDNSRVVRDALERGELLSMNCDELKPKDELLDALGGKSFRSEDECSIAVKSEVERKVKDTVAQFRQEQASEREFAARVCRSVREGLRRAAEREERQEVKEKEKEERTNIKRRRTWVEQKVTDMRKEADRLAEQAGGATGASGAIPSPTPSSTPTRVAADELVYKVIVYLPRSPAFVSEEFLVLGSTPLTALRDQIYCVMDVNVANVDARASADTARECRVSDDRAFFAVMGPTASAGTDKKSIVKFFEDRRGGGGLGNSRHAGHARGTGNAGANSAAPAPGATQGTTPGTMPGTMPGMTPGPTPTPASRPRRATIKTAKMALLANETAEEAAKAAEAANTTKMPIVALPQVPKKATVDLSAPIVEHLRSQGQQCTVASMDNVCFADLGDVSCDKEDLPMLYCHQSCCEHIVKVVDVRFFNPMTDAPWKQQYPYRVYAPGVVMEHRRVCDLCSIESANSVTFNDKNTVFSPYYWCDECFGKIHVDEHGKLLYDDFEMYPYEHGYVNLVGAQGQKPLFWGGED